jgi:sn1-specific diacylglycerol lipase
MPALVFYGGFRSFLAGDDLIVVSRVALAIRLAQLIVLVTVTTMTSDSFYRLRQDVDKLKASCGLSEDFVFRRETLVNRSFEISAAYLISAYLTTIFGAVLEIMIARASSKGTPTRQDERASLKYLCCIKMIPLSLLRVLNTLLGILVIFVLRERCSCGFTQSDYTLECPDVPVWYGWVSGLVVTHFIEAAFVALFAAMFLKKTAGRAPLPSCFNSETKWKLLCKCCCTVSALLTCCFYGGTDSDTTDFADIGIILADFFDSGGKLDIVISDIMLGLRMLARVQKRRQDAARKELIDMIHTEGGTRGNSDDRETKEEEEEEDCDDANMAEFLANIAEGQESEHEIPLATEDDGDSRGKSKRKRSVVYQIKRDKTSPHGLVQPTTRTVLVVGNKRDALAIAEGARFIQLSNSIYEFRITALQTSFLQACSRLTESGRRVAYWCTTKAEETADQTIPLGIPVGAGFQMANNTGRKLLELTGLKDAGMELVYVQFGVGLARQPYCISLDNDWKSIVIAIRGTYSLDDVVADLTMLPESLKEWGEKCGFDSEDCFVHSGMLKSSVWIYNDLETYVLVS